MTLIPTILWYSLEYFVVSITGLSCCLWAHSTNSMAKTLQYKDQSVISNHIFMLSWKYGDKMTVTWHSLVDVTIYYYSWTDCKINACSTIHQYSKGMNKRVSGLSFPLSILWFFNCLVLLEALSNIILRLELLKASKELKRVLYVANVIHFWLGRHLGCRSDSGMRERGYTNGYGENCFHNCLLGKWRKDLSFNGLMNNYLWKLGCPVIFPGHLDASIREVFIEQACHKFMAFLVPSSGEVGKLGPTLD